MVLERMVSSLCKTDCLVTSFFAGSFDQASRPLLVVNTFVAFCFPFNGTKKKPAIRLTSVYVFFRVFDPPPLVAAASDSVASESQPEF